MKSIRVLFVASSHDKMGDADIRTGVWLEEVAAPYYVFKDAGADVAIASPGGGLVPLDPKSESIIAATRVTKRFLKDEEAMSFLSDSLLLEAVSEDDFDVVFLAGGHGAMWDIAGNNTVSHLLEAFNEENKPIGSVCHGVAGLLSVQNGNGELLIKGKHLTCFSNSEEESAGLSGIVPFLLETKLVSLGALYSKAANYISHVVTDGNIISGQNPASSEEVAKRLVAFVQQNKRVPLYFSLS